MELNKRVGLCSIQQLQAKLQSVLARNHRNQRREYFGFLAHYLQNKIK